MDNHDLTSARLKAVARLMEAIAACDHRDRAVLLCAALETLAAGTPDIPFLDLQEEAEEWACLATPYELEAYLIACADRLERTPLAAQARRRIATRLERLAAKLQPRQYRGQKEDRHSP